MIFLYWIKSWVCYYAGDFALETLEMRDEDEKWCNFWCPVYNNLMNASAKAQRAANRWPDDYDDVSKWPWDEYDDNNNKENECQSS